MINNQKEIKIDAKFKVLGRLATEVASILMGKNKTNFAYNKISGDKVLVYNAKHIRLTGNKLYNKKYYSHSGYIGNLKTTSLEDLFTSNPDKVLIKAVKNMLPKNRLQKKWLKNLKVIKGDINVK